MSPARTREFREAFNHAMRVAHKNRADLCSVPGLIETSERWFEGALSPALRQMPVDAAREILARFLLAADGDQPTVREDASRLILIIFDEPASPAQIYEGSADDIADGYARRLETKAASWRLKPKTRARIVDDLRRYLLALEPQGTRKSTAYSPRLALTPFGMFSLGFGSQAPPRMITDRGYWAKELIALLPSRRIVAPTRKKGTRIR